MEELSPEQTQEFENLKAEAKAAGVNVDSVLMNVTGNTLFAHTFALRCAINPIEAMSNCQQWKIYRALAAKQGMTEIPKHYYTMPQQIEFFKNFLKSADERNAANAKSEAAIRMVQSKAAQPSTSVKPANAPTMLEKYNALAATDPKAAQKFQSENFDALFRESQKAAKLNR